MKIILKPTKGIVIEGVEINFNTNINVLKEKYQFEQLDNQYYFFDSDLQVNINENNEICSFSCCGGYESSIEAILDDKNIFKTYVDETVALISESVNEKEVIEEENHIYIWNKCGIACWRSMTSEEVQELIKEATEDGMYDEMKEDIERDIMKSKYFETISLNCKDTK